MIQAGEFAAVLKVATRDGATLSPVLREAWDGKTLRTLAKNSPATATRAHISITAHITHEELARSLDSTEIANGFANRFVWVCARRSKLLPWGGSVRDHRVDGLALEVKRAAEDARRPGEFTFDGDATRLWEASYAKLTEAKPGLRARLSDAAKRTCSGSRASTRRSIPAAPSLLSISTRRWRYGITAHGARATSSETGSAIRTPTRLHARQASRADPH